MVEVERKGDLTARIMYFNSNKASHRCRLQCVQYSALNRGKRHIQILLSLHNQISIHSKEELLATSGYVCQSTLTELLAPIYHNTARLQ